MRLIRGDEGERLPGDLAGLGITRPEWHQLVAGLLDLNAAGALPGICAIVTERRRQIREGATPARDRELVPGTLLEYARRRLDASEIRQAAALLAAEIDRQARP